MKVSVSLSLSQKRAFNLNVYFLSLLQSFCFLPHRFGDRGAKKETDGHECAMKELIIPPHRFTESQAGQAGDWLTVAPGYLEEGLLHSEAGQQN